MNSGNVSYAQEPPPVWEQRLRQVMLVIARIGLGYLFFTQLFWKMPPDFGCPSDYSFTTGSVDENGRVRAGGDAVRVVVERGQRRRAAHHAYPLPHVGGGV